jgi:ubiquitin-protein ligase
VSLRSLLSEPNNDSPLNNQAALLYVLRAAKIYQRVVQQRVAQCGAAQA